MIVDIDYKIRTRGVYGMMNQEINNKNIRIDSKLWEENKKSEKCIDKIDKETIVKCILSIIVPVYNTEKYLKTCLESLLNQDIDKSMYEIICINDGSTDGSLAILYEYAKNTIISY